MQFQTQVYQKTKIPANILWVYILVKLGSCPNDFQNLTTRVTFFRNGLQLDGLRLYFWDQISRFISFPKNFALDFRCKIEGELNKFSKDFSYKIEGEFLRISLKKKEISALKFWKDFFYKIDVEIFLGGFLWLNWRRNFFKRFLS